MLNPFPMRFLLSVLLIPLFAAADEAPQWIWGEQNAETGQAAFQLRFELEQKPTEAVIQVTADDFFALVVNGKFLLFSENWRNLRKVDLSGVLKEGSNTVFIRARNREGAAGVLAWLDIDGVERRIVTNETWETRPGSEDKAGAPWRAPTVLGPLGMEPWGDPWSQSGVDHIRVPDGFVVERVYDVPAAFGSWVALCSDGQGGFYASDQDGKGIYRFRIESGAVRDVEPLPASISGAQGLTMLDGNLYAHVSGQGLVRIEGSKVERLSGSKGRGEHGIHGVVPEPGTRQLLLIGGNSSKLPEVDFSRVAVTYENDLIERFHDPLHIKRKAWVAPAGWICRYHPQENRFETVSVGYRNAYDVAVNAFGDLFTFDSDEEWDLGLPWYRPTRVCVAVSGSDYGWRAGSDNWPSYYEDSLPPIVEIGPGSPTGMLSGRGAKFPGRYQNAIFALDWTYGTMRALHLRPSGAAYEAEIEEFVTGAPLPMTDAVIADDGSMVFLTGGRRIASSVFRVQYTGAESTEAEPPVDSPEARRARELRLELAKFHGVTSAAAVEEAWPHLASTDRFIRHAARLAIEWQPLDSWLERLESETRPQAVITGVVALARVGDSTHAPLAQQMLESLDLSTLDEMPLLGALRAQSLVWERLGVIQPESTVERLLSLFPHESGLATREIARLLAFREEPRMIEPALQVLSEAKRAPAPRWANMEVTARNTGDSYGGTFERYLANRPPETAIRVASFLVELSPHWSDDQARRFFTFLRDLRQYQGGASYGRFQIEFRKRALAKAGPELAAIAAEFPPVAADRRPIHVVPPEGPGRVWTVEAALEAVEEAGWQEATSESGRNLFHATTCIVCHQFDGEGGAIGPDLSNARGKFGPREVLEAIIEPSKAISDQFGSYDIELKSGQVVTGLVIEGSSGEEVSVFAGDKLRTWNRDDVREIRQSPISSMPPGLVNTLNATELRDLVAYLLEKSN